MAELLREAQDGLDSLQPDVLSKATEALKDFQQGEDTFGAYDALRCIISYHHQVALRDGRKPVEALQLAEDHLDDFQQSQDSCGEACMLLSLAEMNMDRRGRKKRVEALEQCLKALKLFQEQKAEKYEVLTELILTNLYFKLEQPKKAQQAADAAAALASRQGVLLGKVLHAAALALAAKHSYGEAAAKAGEARFVYQEEGDQKMEAAELVSVAQWSLKASKPFQALKAAEEALQIFRHLRYGKGWQVKALGYLCEALMALNMAPKAAKLAQDFHAEFEQADDPASAASALKLQGIAWRNSKTPERALAPLEVASEAPEWLERKGWRCDVLQDQAVSFLSSGEEVEALQTLRRALLAARETRDPAKEAKVLRQIFRVHFDRGDLQAAEKAAEEARQVAKATGDIRGEGNDLLRLAVTLASKKRQEEALTKALEAQELCSAHKDAFGEARALRVLSDLRKLDGDLDGALLAEEEGLSLVRNLGDLKLEAEALGRIARLHYADNNLSEACNVTEQSLEVLKGCDLSSRPLMVQMLLLMLEVTLAQHSDVELKSDVRRRLLRWSAVALQLAGKVDPNLRTLALYWRAYLWGMLGRPSTGIRFAQDAQESCKKLGDQINEVRCWLMISQLHSAEGLKEEALDAAKQAAALAQGCGDPEAEEEAANVIEMLTKKKDPPAPVPTSAERDPLLPSSPKAAERTASESSVVPQSEALNAAEVGKTLIRFVKDLTSGTEEVELDTAFIDAGMDSLSGVSLVSMLNRDFETALTPSVVFDYPTIRMLQQYLIQESQE